MAVTARAVRALSLTGEFDALSIAQIDAKITLAESMTNRSVWDTASAGGRDLGDDGVAYLAAHYLALGLRGGMSATGPVTAESAGGMSRQYGLAARSVKVSLAESMLMTTTYGQMYLALRKSLPITPIAANESRAGLYNG